MKDKVYGVCLTKVFREESYGQPEITLCKTRDIAHREFINIVSNRLGDWLPDEYEDEDGTSKDFMTVAQKVQSLKDEGIWTNIMNSWSLRLVTRVRQATISLRLR